MKYFLSFLVFAQLANAATVRTEAESMLKPADRRNINADILEEKLPNQVNALSMVDKIRSFEPQGDKFVVTFWQDNRVFRVPNNKAIIPCLENSYKSERPVTLAIDQKTQTISQCKMFGGTHPGRRSSTSQGTGAAEIGTGTGTGEAPDELETKATR